MDPISTRHTTGLVVTLRDPGLVDTMLFVLEHMIAIWLIILAVLNIINLCRTTRSSPPSCVIKSLAHVLLAKRLGIMGGLLSFYYLILSFSDEYACPSLVLPSADRFLNWFQDYLSWTWNDIRPGLHVFMFGVFQYYLFDQIWCFKKARWARQNEVATPTSEPTTLPTQSTIPSLPKD